MSFSLDKSISKSMEAHKAQKFLLPTKAHEERTQTQVQQHRENSQFQTMLHAWKHPKPGLTGIGATCPSGKCPCLCQGVELDGL